MNLINAQIMKSKYVAAQLGCGAVQQIEKCQAMQVKVKVELSRHPVGGEQLPRIHW
jgi:hypothetical protein